MNVLKKLLAAFTLLAIFIGVASCETEQKKTQPTVLVSVAPYVYFVKRIAHRLYNVVPLVPANANPHVYEPTPQQVEEHRNAFMWVRLGELFDKKVERVFREMDSPITIVDVTEGIELLSTCEGPILSAGHATCDHPDAKDLHIWLSQRLAKIQAKTIANALSLQFPDLKEEFDRNLTTLLEELDFIDKEISQLLQPLKGSAIMASHPAFAYFCNDYGLIQIPVEIEGKEPLPQQVTQIMEQAKAYSIKSILIEPQYSNKGAELIAQRMRIPTHIINPYDEDYANNMLTLAKLIAE